MIGVDLDLEKEWLLASHSNELAKTCIDRELGQVDSDQNSAGFVYNRYARNSRLLDIEGFCVDSHAPEVPLRLCTLLLVFACEPCLPKSGQKLHVCHDLVLSVGFLPLT
jgi:hypothetical protein